MNCSDDCVATSGGTAANGVIRPVGVLHAASEGKTYPSSPTKMARVTDGTSKTMMFGEMSWDCGVQMTWIVGSVSGQDLFGVVYNSKNVQYPIGFAAFENPDRTRTQYCLTTTSLGSKHPGGTHVLMCDVSVHFLSEETDLEGVLRPMASRDAGDKYHPPFN
jgi:Protein of unknown function (DUF1559)